VDILDTLETILESQLIADIESQPLKHTVCIVKFLVFCQFAETNLSNDFKDVKI